ncbi:MAG: hypothetical protein FJW32_03855 [Acidobacteria bacterium]|nr:hypothetical protein [Acidobacteriota bacterium]
MTALGGPLPLKKLPTDPQTIVSWLTSDDTQQRAAAFNLFRIPANYSKPKNVELSFFQLDEDPEYEAAISLRNTGVALLMDKRGASWFATLIDVEEPGLGGGLRLSSRHVTADNHQDILAVTEGRWENGVALYLRIIMLRSDGFHIAHRADLFEVEADPLTLIEFEQCGQIQLSRHLNQPVLLNRSGKRQCAAYAWNPAIVKFVANADATRALCKP